MAELGVLARLRARVFGDEVADVADTPEGGVLVQGDGDLDISDDWEGGISGGEPVLQGGPTVLEHPDLSTRLDGNPRIEGVGQDHGDTLPDDTVQQVPPDEGSNEIAGPPPAPDLTGGLDADPDPSATGPGVRFDLDLDLDVEATSPFDPPEPGPLLDLGSGDLGGGLDAPTVVPGLDVDPYADQPGDFDDLT
jgi:hypothetical protein